MALGGEKARTDILDSLAPLLIQHSSTFTRSRAASLFSILICSSFPVFIPHSSLSSCLDKQPPLLISN